MAPGHYEQEALKTGSTYPCDACALHVVAHSQLVRDKFGGFELAVDKNGKTISPPSDTAVHCEKAPAAGSNKCGRCQGNGKGCQILSKKARVAGAKIADAYLAWVAADHPLDDEAVCGAYVEAVERGRGTVQSSTVTKRPNRRNAAGSATAGGAGCALSGAAVEQLGEVQEGLEALTRVTQDGVDFAANSEALLVAVLTAQVDTNALLRTLVTAQNPETVLPAPLGPTILPPRWAEEYDAVIGAPERKALKKRPAGPSVEKPRKSPRLADKGKGPAVPSEDSE